jgi:peroxiredoxin
MALSRRQIISAIGLVGTAGTLYSAVAVWATHNSERAGCPAKIGQPFPEMQFSTRSGTVRTTRSLAGTSALLLFTTPDCPICKVETPRWKTIAAPYAESIAVWHVTVGPSASPNAAARNNVSAPEALFDDQSGFAKILKASRVPTIVLVDANTIVRGCFVGAQPPAAKREAVEQLASTH